MSDWDVIVVGAGNAALAAAVSAREQGARKVLALEKAPRALRGGNTHYSGGLLRIAFDRAEDLRALVPDADTEVPGFFAGVEPPASTWVGVQALMHPDFLIEIETVVALSAER